jgi:hypothetical protein
VRDRFVISKILKTVLTGTSLPTRMAVRSGRDPK